MATVMLACGCRAMSTHSDEHDGLPAGHPSCVVHFNDAEGRGCKVVEAPDLSGRRARCDYYGSTTRFRNAGPIYGGGDKLGLCENGGKGCRCEVPSSTDLPFFSYLGPGSKHHAARKGPQEFDNFFCGCAGWD